MRDKQIARSYRAVAIVLILLAMPYVSFSRDPSRWSYLSIGWLFFTVALGVAKYRIHQRIHRHLASVASKTGGKFQKGSYLFSVPPTLSFTYKDRRCRIGHAVDPKFDCVIEYVCPVGRELELRIHRRPKKDAAKEPFLVTGSDREMLPQLFGHLEPRMTLQGLLEEFEGFYLGKDGLMKLIAPYDSRFTEPARVLATFDKMIKLAQLIESKR